MTTPVTEPGLRLTVLVGESDNWHHRPVYTEIVHRAHAAGLSGASVFRGIEGFGASSMIHTQRLLSLSEDLPVAVVIVDTEAAVRAFLPQITELADGCSVTLDACEIVRRDSSRAREGGTDPGIRGEQR
ncbi:DUF190 domain-containing protein [Streptomyces sp. A0958]|uniref:DUF190 domain-containing protein n=1 Tax=Streptomyces sp. A0958 TaxID=2563101 RepID=UPI00109E5E21|nr:DUF190 domain-containing protein [Streptomyces sp. A0958]THA60530.1 DUF190 domain-containing protein [Streptomyces sp. A0958]